MRPLHFMPPLMADEPIDSFLSRLAARHGVRMARFCSEVGLSSAGLVKDLPSDLDRLSSLTGIDVATLGARTFRPLIGAENSCMHMGQVLQRRRLRHNALHACPLCLREDIDGAELPITSAAHVRTPWLVDAVHACPTHDVALVQAGERVPASSGAQHDLATRLQPLLADLDRVVGGASPCRATRLEGYAVDRLAGRATGEEMLDGMPFHAAVRICEMLGAAALYGPHAPIGTFGRTEWRAAGEIGYDVAAGGPASIEGCLSYLSRDHGAPDGNTGPISVFGLLYRWLKKEEARSVYWPILAPLREIIIRTIPLPAGFDLLGTRLDARRVHTVQSASTTGVGVKFIRRELRSAGVLVSNGHDRSHRPPTISIEQATAIAAMVADTVEMGEAKRILGASVSTVRKLADAGVIRPRVAERGKKEKLLFSRTSLHAFMERLLTAAPMAEVDQAGLSGISTAAQRTGRTLAHVTAMVASGRLRSAMRIPGPGGFSSIRVDPEEISATIGLDHPGHLGIDAVARELRMTRQTALALVHDGHLRATRIPLGASRRSPLVVPELVLARFTARYATLTTLAARRGVHPGALKARLDREGVRPAFRQEGVCRTLIYRLADLGGATPVRGGITRGGEGTER